MKIYIVDPFLPEGVERIYPTYLGGYYSIKGSLDYRNIFFSLNDPDKQLITVKYTFADLLLSINGGKKLNCTRW